MNTVSLLSYSVSQSSHRNSTDSRESHIDSSFSVEGFSENLKPALTRYVCVLSRVQLFATLWTAALQAPLSVEFTRQELWSGAGVQPRWIQGIRRVDGVGVERLVYLII